MSHRSLRLAIIGGRGFIGGAIARQAAAAGHEVQVHAHDAVAALGRVDAIVYCSGVAWGAQERPLDAFDAHVSSVERLLRSKPIGRFIYVSSTRVYDGAPTTRETENLVLAPPYREDVYRLSKIAGEAVVLTGHPNASVLRLSNVYGRSYSSGLFLSDVLRQAATTGVAKVRTSPESAKDYVCVDDVASAVVALCVREHAESIYNIANGTNTKHEEIFAFLRSHGIRVEVPHGAPAAIAAPIDIERIRHALPWSPRALLDDLPQLLSDFRLNVRPQAAR